VARELADGGQQVQAQRIDLAAEVADLTAQLGHLAAQLGDGGLLGPRHLWAQQRGG
jgi:hypothetical protein